LGKNNDKANPAIFASEKNLEGKCAMDSFNLVMKYQDLKQDEAQKSIDKVKEIMEKIGTV
jgi:hypothetical protein